MLPDSDNPFLILRKLRWYSASFIMTIIIIMLQVVGMCRHIFAMVVPIFLATLVQAICRSEIYSWECMKKKCLFKYIRVEIE